MKALVVFRAAGGHPLSRLLKPGFGHCFAVVSSKGLWIKIDYEIGVPSIEYVTADDGAFDLAAYYRECGMTVVETEQGSTALTGPFVPSNCVGLVKSILCVRAPFVLTPWQLLRHLEKTRCP